MKKLFQDISAIGNAVSNAYAKLGKVDITNRFKCFLLLILVVTTSIIYSNILNNPFVFDDYVITETRSLRLTDLSFDTLRDAIGGFDRSIPRLTLALNYYFHGFDVRGYHAVNIAIHIMTGIFLFFFIWGTMTLDTPRKQLLKDNYELKEKMFISFLAVLLWLVHPLQVQSVTYTVQRLVSIASMFYILSLFLYLKFRLAQRIHTKILLLGGCIISGILAIASKETAVTLPGFMILYELFFLQDFRKKRAGKHLIYAAVLFSVISVPIIWWLSKAAITTAQIAASMYGHSIVGLILSQPRIFLYYFSLFLFPHPGQLNIDHDFVYSTSLFEPFSNIPAMIIMCAILTCAVLLLRKDRLISFSILWVIGNYIIRSSLFGNDTIFEHRMYLSSMMLSLILVLIIFRYLKPKVLALGILCIAIVVCSIWTYERNKVWGSEYLLWSDSVKKSPNKARPHNNLGLALADMGRSDKAIEQYHKALQINPIYHKAYNNLGNLYEKEGRYEEAIRLYEDVLKRKPSYVTGNYNIANIYMKIGDLAKAENHYVTALIFKPDHVKSIANLAAVMMKQGRIKEAVSLGYQALKLEPYDAEIMTNLGGALLLRGETENAIYYLEKALTLSTDIEEAKINLTTAREALLQAKNIQKVHAEDEERKYHLLMRQGLAFLKLNAYEAAVDEFSTALLFRPNDFQALNNLATSYRRQYKYYNAMIMLKKMLLIEPGNAIINYNIACMYSLLSKPEEALFWLDRALDYGFDEWDLIQSDPDLGNIRDLELFDRIVQGRG